MDPNFFIIGAPKSGTTAMAHYISTHPNVYFSTIKELQFFSDDIQTAKSEMIPKNMSEYLKNFKDADPDTHKIVAEGSTQYLRSKKAIKNITDNFDAPKFLVMLRNPVQAVHALHMEALYGFNESEKDFEKAWFNSIETQKRIQNIKEPIDDHTLYAHIASYYQQVERLLMEVPKESVMILTFDEFVKDTKKSYELLLNFLGLDSDNKNDFEIINSSHAHRWEFISKFILSPPDLLVEPFIFIRKKIIENETFLTRYIKAKLNVKKKRKPIDKRFENYLKDYFREDILKLSNLINKDLDNWLK